MQYLILGLAALLIGLIVLHMLKGANPAVLARHLKLAGGTLALAGAGVLAVRGMMGYAFPLAMLGSWLLWGGSGAGGPFGRAKPTPGQTSAVVTDHLEVELDLDTGDVQGKVIKGMFAGRTLKSLRAEELALLWQDCRHDDPPSAQIIEAYLDRTHPSWRDDVERGEREMGRGPDGRMTVAEAYEILGLSEGANAEDIRRAHRELMMKVHPDRGGSKYLAAKINEAKDVLLGR